MSTRHQHFSFDYRTFVASRSKAPGQILTTLNLDKVDLLHAAWGIAGEVMEYYLAPNQSNKIEELHDIGFYIQMIENRFGEVSVQLPPEPVKSDNEFMAEYRNPYLDLLNKANTFFDLAKKFVIYNQAEKQDMLVEAFAQFKCQWAVDLRKQGITIEEANLLNQSKLIKRYSNGYSDKAAAERADKPAGE